MEYPEGVYLSEQWASYAEKMPRIAAGGNNRLWAVWTSHDEEQDYITCKCLENDPLKDYNSVLDSEAVLESISFIESSKINGPEKGNFRPVIAAGGGAAAAAWTVFRDKPAVVGRLYRGGRWSEVFTIAEGAHWPEICCLVDGRFFVAYLQEEDGELNVQGKWLRAAADTAEITEEAVDGRSRGKAELSRAVLLSTAAVNEKTGEAGNEKTGEAGNEKTGEERRGNAYRPVVFAYKDQVFVTYDQYSRGGV